MSPKSNSGNGWRASKRTEETESLKSINGNGKEVPLVKVAECPGSSSGDSFQEVNEPWDTATHKQNPETRSSDKSTEIQDASYDGKGREAQHIV